MISRRAATPASRYPLRWTACRAQRRRPRRLSNISGFATTMTTSAICGGFDLDCVGLRPSSLA
jgi:hypothetical protein